jgi:hypothetical protein
MPGPRLPRTVSTLLAAVLTLLAVAVPPAVAAPADRYLDTRITLDVFRVSTAAGTIHLQVLARHEESGVNFLYWPAGADPDVDPPSLVHGDLSRMTVVLDGRTATITFPVAPAGGGEGLTGDDTVVVVAELDAASEPVVIDETRTFGNRKARFLGWEQSVLSDGTVTLPDGTGIPFAGVTGQLALVETLWTNPDTMVEKGRYSDINVALELPDAVVVVMGQLGDIHWGWIQVARLPFDPEEPALIGGFQVPSADPLELSFQIPVGPFDGPPVGVADLVLSYSAIGEPVTWWTHLADVRVRTVEQPLSVNGLVTFPGLAPVELDGSEATFVDRQLQFHDPDGGRAGGPRPVNDLPDGAIELPVGGQVRNVWTGGADIEGEHAFPGEIGRTVWYRIIGTGDSIVIDTDASDFDTMLIAYAVVDGELVQVASADDQAPGRTPAVVDMQARLVLDTEAGAEYLIQVGAPGPNYREGLPPEVGRLFLTVELAA